MKLPGPLSLTPEDVLQGLVVAGLVFLLVTLLVFGVLPLRHFWPHPFRLTWGLLLCLPFLVLAARLAREAARIPYQLRLRRFRRFVELEEQADKISELILSARTFFEPFLLRYRRDDSYTLDAFFRDLAQDTYISVSNEELLRSEADAEVLATYYRSWISRERELVPEAYWTPEIPDLPTLLDLYRRRGLLREEARRLAMSEKAAGDARRLTSEVTTFLKTRDELRDFLQDRRVLEYANLEKALSRNPSDLDYRRECETKCRRECDRLEAFEEALVQHLFRVKQDGDASNGKGN